NQAQKGVDWQFTTSDARRKLKRLYPMILEN
ncbi:MAG: Transposase, partial [Methanoculleus marisnigri]